MISEIRIGKSPKCVSWWDNAPALTDKKSIKFKNGLNIVWAPNGAGKSTLLTAISRTLQCEESFVPTISKSSVESMHSSDLGVGKILKGLNIIHDGELCFSFNPEIKIGRTKGYVDDDYLKEILLDNCNNYSSGTAVQDNMVRILESLRSKDTEIDYKIDRSFVNSLWQKRIDNIKAVLKGTKPPTGVRTLLLDEPCRSVDLPRQRQIWEIIENYATRYQIIVATHNPMALNIENANYIDLEKGFLKTCRESFS